MTDEKKRELIEALRPNTLFIEQFRKAFQLDPANALYWSHDVFEKAALAEVQQSTSTLLLKHTVDVVRAELQKQVNNSALYPSNSTSPTANVMSQARASARAKVLETIDNFIKYGTTL